MGSEGFGYDEDFSPDVDIQTNSNVGFGDDKDFVPEPPPFTERGTPPEPQSDLIDYFIDTGKGIAKGIPAAAGGGLGAKLATAGTVALGASNPAILAGAGILGYFLGNTVTRHGIESITGDESLGGAAVDAALDTAFVGKGIGKRAIAASIEKSLAETATKEAGIALGIRDVGVIGSVNRAVERLQSILKDEFKKYPRALKTLYSKGERFVINEDGALSVKKGKKPVNFPELQDQLDENLNVLTKFRNQTANDLDNLSLQIQKDKSGKGQFQKEIGFTGDVQKEIGFTGSVPVIPSDEFLPSTKNFRLLEALLGSDPELTAFTSRFKELESILGDRSRFSFKGALEKISEINDAMAPYLSKDMAAKAGKKMLKKAFEDLKDNVYEGMAARVKNLQTEATHRKLPFPKAAKNWSGIFKDLNNRISIEKAFKDGAGAALDRSQRIIDTSRAKETALSAAGQVATPELKVRGPSTGERLSREAMEENWLGSRGELFNRNRRFNEYMGAIESGAVPEVPVPSALDVGNIVGKGGLGTMVARAVPGPVTKETGLAATSMLAPEEAQAQDLPAPTALPPDSVGLPEQDKIEVEKRAQELGFTPEIALMSAMASAGPMPGMMSSAPLPNLGMSAMGTAGAEDEIKGPTKPLPRTTDAFFKLSAADMPPELLSDPEMRNALVQAQGGTTEEKRQALYLFTQKLPEEYFQSPPSHLRSYKSLVDDKLLDDKELDNYRNDMLEAFEGIEDENERILLKSKYLNALNTSRTVLETRNPIPRKAIDPLPEIANTEPPAPERKIKFTTLDTMAKGSKLKKTQYSY